VSAPVTVLIATYNRSRYLDECLDSVLSQSVSPCQVIVVDDGSSDDTFTILKTYRGNITVLRKENGGKASALNMGLKHVTGDYVWIFDDDDVALSTSIERRLEVLQSRPELGFVYSAHYFGCDGPDAAIRRLDAYQLKHVPEQSVFSEVLKGYFFALQGVLARADCYRVLGEFDETLLRSQDYDMLIRLARRFPCTGINEPTFIFRRHGGSRGPNGARHSLADRERVWLQYDQSIGRSIRKSLRLSEYLPERSKGDAGSNGGRREALWHRMAVMSSKGLIAEMLDDLEAASKEAGAAQETGLNSFERKICREAVCHPYFVSTFSEPESEFFGRIGRVARTGAGRSAIRALSRGLFWLARSDEQDSGTKAHLLRNSVRLMLLSLGLQRNS